MRRSRCNFHFRPDGNIIPRRLFNSGDAVRESFDRPWPLGRFLHSRRMEKIARASKGGSDSRFLSRRKKTDREKRKIAAGDVKTMNNSGLENRLHPNRASAPYLAGENALGKEKPPTKIVE